MDTCRDHPESFGPKILRPICQLQHPESVGTPRIPESTSHRVTRGDNMAASTATPRRSKAAVLPADLRRLERGASRGSVRAARLRRQLHTLAGRQVLHRRVAGPPTVRTDCSLPALIRPLTPAFLSPAAPTATAIATRIAVDVRRVVVPMPTHAPLDQPRAHAPTVTPSHDKRPRRPRGPRRITPRRRSATSTTRPSSPNEPGADASQWGAAKSAVRSRAREASRNLSPVLGANTPFGGIAKSAGGGPFWRLSFAAKSRDFNS